MAMMIEESQMDGTVIFNIFNIFFNSLQNLTYKCAIYLCN